MVNLQKLASRIRSTAQPTDSSLPPVLPFIIAMPLTQSTSRRSLARNLVRTDTVPQEPLTQITRAIKVPERITEDLLEIHTRDPVVAVVAAAARAGEGAVSYTHLTLPTIYSV